MIIQISRCIPEEESIDLLNVSFGDFDKTPDRLSALSSLSDLKVIAPNRIWNLIKVSIIYYNY